MATQSFAFTDGNSGKVAFTGFAYTATTGWTNVTPAKNDNTGLQARGMMQFDTGAHFSSLDVASIDMVELFVIEELTQSITPPDAVYVYMGNFIGPALNGNAGEYNGGTDLTLDILPYGSAVYIDLFDGLVDPTGLVNLTGTTDIALRPHNATSKNSIRDYNTSKSKCQLRVTYTLNATDTPLRALMGVGLCIAAWLGINWNPLQKTITLDPI